ncbi:hypothetical protein ACS0VI_16630 [Streptomyces sp. H28]|uniref:hypothetical protein n=1 Tax=Streptomyces sp. H28 TaxID=2775865 RepID=UPI001CE046F0|nr:hypothetical protein [Streptomyces sp. H28]
MTGRRPSWPDEAYEVMAGDLTVAVAYLTPAGGAVVTSVSPVGIVDRATGRVGFTTSLGFPRKLERILHDPHVSVAYHTRLHGFAAHDGYVLAQGSAAVDLSPSAQRLARVMDASEDFLGRAKRGKAWDWLLREYHQERVFVDIDVARLATWPDLSARGPMTVAGPSWPRQPDPQRPPAKGTAPRVGVPGLARQIAPLPHRLLAYRGADGHPVVLPVRVTGHDEAGLRLTAPPGLLPPGGRRAGFLAHAFGPQCVGLSMRTLTGWLTVHGDEARYAPHTSRGMTAPANRTVQALANGLLAKHGVRRARRNGTTARLHHLAGLTGQPPGRAGLPPR